MHKMYRRRNRRRFGGLTMCLNCGCSTAGKFCDRCMEIIADEFKDLLKDNFSEDELVEVIDSMVEDCRLSDLIYPMEGI